MSTACGSREPLKNYLSCLRFVKNSLKMLIYCMGLLGDDRCPLLFALH